MNNQFGGHEVMIATNPSVLQGLDAGGPAWTLPFGRRSLCERESGIKADRGTSAKSYISRQPISPMCWLPNSSANPSTRNCCCLAFGSRSGEGYMSPICT